MSCSDSHKPIWYDEVIQEDDPGIAASGLKAVSVIRIGRLAVIEGEVLLGAIGEIGSDRLQRIKKHLADWLMQS